MGNLATHVSPKRATQREKARKDQVKNSAGGYVFKLSAFERLQRFLILGSTGGTYYVGEKKLTKDNAACINACLDQDPEKTVNIIREVSDSGRAPKNEPAIFALAIATCHEKAKPFALAALRDVCRIPTHLFYYVEALSELGKGGRSVRRALSSWYNGFEPKRLGYNVVKYQQRNGWSHKDVLSLAHPRPRTTDHEAIFRWIFKEDPSHERAILDKNKTPVRFYKSVTPSSEAFHYIEGFEKAKVETDPRRIAKLVREYGLTREMVPTQALKSPEVWDALFEEMPLEAMIRNLGKMSQVGLIKPLSNASQTVVQRLHDRDYLRKARIHPFKVLVALMTYQQGHGMRGDLIWNVDQQVVSALDDCFYLCFDFVEPTNKRFVIGLDVSGSMSWPCGDLPMTCAQASAAMAMTFVRKEPRTYTFGFSDTFKDLKINPKDSLNTVLEKTSNMNFGGTDASIPPKWALANEVEADVFITITDNETWAGEQHTYQALNEYRNKINPNAFNVVIGMTATDFSIADPNDPLALDVVGMDTSVPTVVADIIRG